MWASWAAAVAVLATPLACQPPGTSSPGGTSASTGKIQHVVVVMQENRSFDSYFGTYPGAEGLPRRDGQFTVCLPDPAKGGCAKPYHDPNDLNGGGPHGTDNGRADINGGRMDGFVQQAETAPRGCFFGANDPSCSTKSNPDVMGYHDAREIPNYWKYAQSFVLQDRMFQPDLSWSLPSHLFLVSEWSARCKVRNDPMSCVNDTQSAALPPDFGPGPHQPPNYAWTDLTYLLHAHRVSWKYYVAEGTQPDCQNDEAVCPPVTQRAGTPGIWNPLPWFSTVRQDGELGNIQPVTNLYQDSRSGKLPQVSWVTPNGENSEHPPGLVSAGQSYVTGLVNAIMQGPNWSSTAIFISWDDWGGFYDHVVPPVVDQNGYGLRVPGLLISPYARKGLVDHQTLSFDAYDRFIEDVFLKGLRIDPKTDGRPDSRQNVRENASVLGDLRKEFDFNQPPRRPLVLSTSPSPGPASAP
ncbi:MAG: phospholipase [Candidatus Dormibacteraeota bacterium]|nr:phospholipase [Candidatus Dormibacteraeota bacterium]